MIKTHRPSLNYDLKTSKELQLFQSLRKYPLVNASTTRKPVNQSSMYTG